MAHISLSIDAPTLSAYDPDNPTQATEELNLQLHNILQDMETAGWYLEDMRIDDTDLTNWKSVSFGMMQDVFSYAADAIASFRSTGDPDLAAPLAGDISNWTAWASSPLVGRALDLWISCMKIKHLIYYMWETEEDPLRVKDYIRDLLISWPLTDLTVELKDEGGSELKIYPSWKNLET